MSSYVDSCNFRQASEATSPNTMFSFDLSGRESSRYEGVNVNAIFTCPVPTTSSEREEMKTSLRGSTDTPLPPGPQITMVSSSSVEASGLNYGGTTLLGRGADRDPERSAKSGSNKSQESDRKAENAQTVKRNANQRQDIEQRPQIYPWMTKLHMSNGKVCLFSKKCDWDAFPYSLLTLLHFFSSDPVSLLSFIGQTQEIIKTRGHKFYDKGIHCS